MIPPDLIEFLTDPSNRTLSCSAGEVREAILFAPDELTLKAFDVHSYALHSNGLLETDPDEEREFQAYDLVKACGAYEPGGILVWFPEFNQYGSWDCDHHTIITYPGVAWKDIANDPTWYVNGQWFPDKVRHTQINPWEHP